MKWYKEPSLYEDVSSTSFWILGVFIVASTFWVNRQINLFDKYKEETNPGSDKSEDDTASESQGTPASTTSPPRPSDLWLQPHITSLPRQALAIIVCSFVFGLELLEGSWVLRTAWRWTTTIWKNTWSSMRSYVVGLVLYLPTTIAVLAAWAAVLSIGVFIVAAQLLYISALFELKPGARIRLPSDQNPSKKKKESEKGDDLQEDEKSEYGIGSQDEEKEPLL